MPSLLPRQLLSINVAQASPLTIEGRRIMTAIGKRAVSTLAEPHRIDVKPLGLQGDDQADVTVHGGLSKAVYAYPHEHYDFWQTVRAQASAQAWGEAMPHGMLGENLTLTGLLEGDVYVGDVLQFADCSLAVSEPRRPCYKFQAVMGFKQAVKMMAQSGYCGFYLTVRQAGTISAGESYELIPGPREVSIAELFKTKMHRHID
ncbi:MAG: MOSC domain-containing protein [Aquabacterium sp.]|uniref:MOSC domain-containing protein n=1 Tax=Aquabacterium sp. TaxID=1872578 RepID=UPI0012297C9D|nr:MOSC domain-containing protein [Aquabacterium sp.]TAK94280.1 MAG: MOSC domain-containing protein [Aquabacterium sp.]